MIIKKQRFNLTPRCKGKWPFTVPEVAVMMIRSDNKAAKKINIMFAVVHDFDVFALSGGLESHGLKPLVKSGIWADDYSTKRNGEVISAVAKKSLSPLFEYLKLLVESAGVKREK